MKYNPLILHLLLDVLNPFFPFLVYFFHNLSFIIILILRITCTIHHNFIRTAIIGDILPAIVIVVVIIVSCVLPLVKLFEGILVLFLLCGIRIQSFIFFVFLFWFWCGRYLVAHGPQLIIRLLKYGAKHRIILNKLYAKLIIVRYETCENLYCTGSRYALLRDAQEYIDGPMVVLKLRCLDVGVELEKERHIVFAFRTNQIGLVQR